MQWRTSDPAWAINKAQWGAEVRRSVIVTGSLLDSNDHPIVIWIDYNKSCYYNATMHNNECANQRVQWEA